MTLLRFGSLIVVLAAFGKLGQAQVPTVPVTKPASYAALLARLQSRDTSIDFAELRMALAASDEYSPYGSDGDAHRDSMGTAFARHDYRRVAAEADSALHYDYLDIRTHVLKAYALEQLGDTATSNWHRVIASRLVRSITASGQGTVQSPYVVIAVPEEYAVLAILGYAPSGTQAVVPCGAHECDVIETAHRETHESRDFYFDITLPRAHLARLFPEK